METAPDKGVSIWLNVYPPQLPDCLIRVGWLVCMIGCREHVSVASDNTYAPLCACECSAHVFTCPSSRLVGGGGGRGVRSSGHVRSHCHLLGRSIIYIILYKCM